MVGSEVVQGKQVAVRRERVSLATLPFRGGGKDERANVVEMLELKERLGASGESIGVGRLKNDSLRAVADDELGTGNRGECQFRQPRFSSERRSSPVGLLVSIVGRGELLDKANALHESVGRAVDGDGLRVLLESAISVLGVVEDVALFARKRRIGQLGAREQSVG